MTQPSSTTGNTNTTGESDAATEIVLKVGGALLTRREDLDELSRYLAQRRDAGYRVVLVHGGGPEISELHRRLGVPFEQRRGLRVTSDEGMQLTTMVLCGAVSTRIVARLVSHGVAAIGLSGVDLGLLRTRLAGEQLWGRVGESPRVSVQRLRQLLDSGLTPVVAPVSLAPDGEPVNVNADHAAHAIATALAAHSLELVSDVPGVMTGSGVLECLDADELPRLITARVVKGGMIPKLQAAVAAVRAGVERVRIGSFSAMAAGTATEVTA